MKGKFFSFSFSVLVHAHDQKERGHNKRTIKVKGVIPAAETRIKFSVPSLRLSREFCDMNCLGGIEKSNR